MTTLPDALVIGPQRAGTTWIHYYLETHRDVIVSSGVKETFFFDRHYERGIDWYSSHFRSVPHASARCIEVAPSYFHHPDAPSRVFKHLGEIPLICTLRNPADRSFSLYLLLQSYGLTKGGFREAVQQRPEILDTSRYRTHIERWMKLFGRERMLFLFQETLAVKPDQYARQICKHLEIPFVPIDASLARPVNRPSVPRSRRLARAALCATELARSWGAYGVLEFAKGLGLKTLIYGKPGGDKLPRLTAEDRQWVMEQLADEIDGLEDVIQEELPHWRMASPAARAA